MSISTTCPSCQASFSLPDELSGRKVKCQKCAHVFQVPKEDETPPPVLKAAPDDDGDVAPKKSGVSAGAPKSKGPPPVKKRRDSDDEDAPRKRRDRQETKSGSGAGMIILILALVGGGLLGCVGCGVAGLWFVIPVGGKGGGGGGFVIADKDFQPPPPDRPRFDDFKKDFDKAPDKDFWFKDKDKDKDGPPFDRPFPDRPFFDKKDFIKDKDFPKDFDKKFDPFQDKFKIDPKPAPPIRVTFGPDGNYTSKNALTMADGMTQIGPFESKRAKVYLATLQAGVSYQIDMIHTGGPDDFFDAYLFLLENGKILMRDDDSGGGLNARIIFRSARTAEYSIIATTLGGGGTGSFTLSIKASGKPAVAFPAPPEAPIRDVTSRIVRFPKAGMLVGDTVWTADGKSFFALSTSGTLWRVNAETHAFEKTLELKQNCVGMAMSSKGLLVGVRDTTEVWVIDPADLDVVKAKIAVPQLKRITAAPTGKYAIASGAGEFGGEGLYTLDLEKAAIAQRYPRLSGRHVVASPDGKFVFAQGGIEELVRYRLDDGALTQEDSSGRIAQNGQRICVSSDGKYVCLPSGGGNYGAGSYATHIYPFDNLRAPACTISSGAYPRAVGFDVKNGLIFAQKFDTPLRIYNFTGQLVRDYKIPVIPGPKGFGGSISTDGISEFNVAPQGFEFLVRSNGDIMHVKLHRSKAPVGKDDPPKDGPKTLVKAIRKVGSFTFTDFNPGALQPIIPYATPACWDATGKNLYFLENGKELYRINHRDMKIEATTTLPAPATAIAMSSEGIVVAPAVGEVLVLDPEKLTVKIKSNVLPSSFVAVPSLGLLLTSTGMYDVKATLPGLKTEIVNAPASYNGLRAMALSPDGKYLCVQTADFSFHRLRIEGKKLVHEQTKPAETKQTADIAISPDSRRVVFAYTGVTAKKTTTTTEILALEDWNKVLGTIPARLRKVAMDANGGLYGESPTSVLRYYPDPIKSPTDVRTTNVNFAFRRLIAPPQGTGCLVLSFEPPQLWRATWIEPNK